MKNLNSAETTSLPRHSIVRIAINSPIEDYEAERERERRPNTRPKRKKKIDRTARGFIER